MKLPRNAQLWGPPYVGDRLRRRLRPGKIERVWLAIADHYEPLWRGASPSEGAERVKQWSKVWPSITRSVAADSAGNAPCYTFFYPVEQYRPELLDPLAMLARQAIAEVEVHIHHDRDSRQHFIDTISGFCETLHTQHDLLRTQEGKLRFGFIHGNWALDNSRPDGRWCGLNDEITLLRDLGCYADFTMPSGDSPTQARTVNTIYWAKDDPLRPKSYDHGKPLCPGGDREGDLLMVPGPLGVRWAERLKPRMEIGEIAAGDPPTAYRVKRWLALAPRIGGDVFIKLHTHGATEGNAAMLLGGGLKTLFAEVARECNARHVRHYFVSTWQMYCAIEALRRNLEPVSSAVAARRATMAGAHL
jgi:hypothetical protein